MRGESTITSPYFFFLSSIRTRRRLLIWAVISLAPISLICQTPICFWRCGSVVEMSCPRRQHLDEPDQMLKSILLASHDSDIVQIQHSFVFLFFFVSFCFSFLFLLFSFYMFFFFIPTFFFVFPPFFFFGFTCFFFQDCLFFSFFFLYFFKKYLYRFFY